MPLSITYRTNGAWGSGIGANLTAAQVDTNFYNIATAVNALQAAATGSNNIVSVTSDQTSITFNLQDGSKIGPIPLPVLQFMYRGAWAPATIYNTLDTFTVSNVGLFTVLLAHTSGGTFNQNATFSLSTSGNTLNGSNAISNINPATGLIAGSTYNITGTGIPSGATLSYTGGGNGNLSAPATATGTGVALVISSSSPVYNMLLPITNGATALSQLTDVLLTSLTDGQILQYSGAAAKWENIPYPALSTLTDVSLGTLANGQALTWNSGASKWENSSITANMTTLGDVTLTALADNQILQYHASDAHWHNVNLPSGTAGSVLNPRGNWVSGTVYAPGDVVRDGPGFFVAFAGVGGSVHPAADSTHWAEVSIIDGMGLDTAFGSALAAPAAPSLSASTTGGTLVTGTVFVKLTLVDPAGETAASAEASIAVTGPTGSVTVTSPPATGDATGYRIYASTTTGLEQLQNGGTAVAIGTNYTIASIAAGAAAPTHNIAATGGLIHRASTGWSLLQAGANGTYLGSAGPGQPLAFSMPPLAGLNDVTLTSLADKQYLRYDSASGHWLNTSAGDFIGTASITGSGTTPGALNISSYGAVSGAPAGWICGLRANGTVSMPTAVANNNVLSAYSGAGWDGSAWSPTPTNGAAGYSVQASENWTSTAHGARLVLQTVKNGTTTAFQTFTVENDGGLIAPQTVTGGSQGPGTINVSGGYYVNGSPVVTTANLAGTLDAIGSTQGDVLYRGASGWNALAPGTSGQVLTTGGTGANPSWTTAGLPSIASGHVIGNGTGSTAAAADTTISAILDQALGNAQGDVIYRGSAGWSVLAPGTSGQVLQTGGASANPSWVTPASGGLTQLTGDVTAGPGSGSQAATIAANAVSNSKLAQMGANTIKGNNTGSTANAADLTGTQVTALLSAMVGDTGSGGTKGLAPAPASGDAAAAKFLKADGTWQTPSSGIGLIVVASKTANYTVTSADNGTHFDNQGATGTVTFTLPTAAVGLHYTFTVDAAHTVNVTAGGSDAIAIGQSNTGAGGSRSSADPYSLITIECHKTGQWVTSSIVGDWA